MFEDGRGRGGARHKVFPPTPVTTTMTVDYQRQWRIRRRRRLRRRLRRPRPRHRPLLRTTSTKQGRRTTTPTPDDSHKRRRRTTKNDMQAWRRGHLQPLSEDSGGAQSTRQHGLKMWIYCEQKQTVFGECCFYITARASGQSWILEKLKVTLCDVVLHYSAGLRTKLDFREIESYFLRCVCVFHEIWRVADSQTLSTNEIPTNKKYDVRVLWGQSWTLEKLKINCCDVCVSWNLKSG